MHTFTEEDFIAQIKKSKSWGEPTNELFEMMEELIIEVANELGDPDCNVNAGLVEASLNDFESNDLLQNLVDNCSLLFPAQVIADFKSSVCCTFKHHKRRL